VLSEIKVQTFSVFLSVHNYTNIFTVILDQAAGEHHHLVSYDDDNNNNNNNNTKQFDTHIKNSEKLNMAIWQVQNMNILLYNSILTCV
jgi:hypothetical protein